MLVLASTLYSDIEAIPPFEWLLRGQQLFHEFLQLNNYVSLCLVPIWPFTMLEIYFAGLWPYFVACEQISGIYSTYLVMQILFDRVTCSFVKFFAENDLLCRFGSVSTIVCGEQTF